MTNDNAVIAVFSDQQGPETTVKRLDSAGIEIKHLSVVGKGYHTDEKVHLSWRVAAGQDARPGFIHQAVNDRSGQRPLRPRHHACPHVAGLAARPLDARNTAEDGGGIGLAVLCRHYLSRNLIEVDDGFN